MLFILVKKFLPSKDFHHTPIPCIRAIPNFTNNYQTNPCFLRKPFMKCILTKLVNYQLRLGKLPMMDVYVIAPWCLSLHFIIDVANFNGGAAIFPRFFPKNN